MYKLILTGVGIFALLSFGGEKGFKISEIQKGSIYEQLGLQNADTVKGVNGKEVESIESLAVLLSEAKPREKISVTIVRNGRPMTLYYTVK